MRVLFYLGGSAWTGSARAFLTAARGLQDRGHQTTIACRAGTQIVERLAGQGVDTLLLDSGGGQVAQTWGLRRVLRERFIEVAFVHTDAEQLAVGSAMRLAERGAIIRRIPPLADLPDPGVVARRLAAAGLLVSTQSALDLVDGSVWTIPPAVAPPGVDVPSYSSVAAVSRRSLGLSEDARLIGCPYEANGRPLLGNVLRAFKLLSGRHPELYVAVIGPAATDEHLRLHAAAIGVSRRVLFLGDCEDDRAAIAACDLVWITADADGGAFAFLDSMALERCVVAERTPLAEHYLADGLTGVMLPAGDADAVAASVASVLAHPDRRARMGRAARSRVERERTEAAMVDGFEGAGRAAGDRTRWVVR